jgi:hypothetical protein
MGVHRQPHGKRLRGLNFNSVSFFEFQMLHTLIGGGWVQSEPLLAPQLTDFCIARALSLSLALSRALSRSLSRSLSLSLSRSLSFSLSLSLSDLNLTDTLLARVALLLSWS